MKFQLMRMLIISSFGLFILSCSSNESAQPSINDKNDFKEDVEQKADVKKYADVLDTNYDAGALPVTLAIEGSAAETVNHRHHKPLSASAAEKAPPVQQANETRRELIDPYLFSTCDIAPLKEGNFNVEYHVNSFGDSILEFYFPEADEKKDAADKTTSKNNRKWWQVFAADRASTDSKSLDPEDNDSEENDSEEVEKTPIVDDPSGSESGDTNVEYLTAVPNINSIQGLNIVGPFETLNGKYIDYKEKSEPVIKVPPNTTDKKINITLHDPGIYRVMFTCSKKDPTPNLSVTCKGNCGRKTLSALESLLFVGYDKFKAFITQEIANIAPGLSDVITPMIIPPKGGTLENQLNTLASNLTKNLTDKENTPLSDYAQATRDLVKNVQGNEIMPNVSVTLDQLAKLRLLVVAAETWQTSVQNTTTINPKQNVDLLTTYFSDCVELPIEGAPSYVVSGSGSAGAPSTDGTTFTYAHYTDYSMSRCQLHGGIQMKKIMDSLVNGGSFNYISKDKKYTQANIQTPRKLIEALIASGHRVELWKTKTFANFISFQIENEAQNLHMDAKFPLWVKFDSDTNQDDSFSKKNEIPVSHEQYEVNIVGKDIVGRFTFFLGISGVGFWPVTDVRPEWTGGRKILANYNSGVEADKTKILDILDGMSAYYKLIRAESDLLRNNIITIISGVKTVDALVDTLNNLGLGSVLPAGTNVDSIKTMINNLIQGKLVAITPAMRLIAKLANLELPTTVNEGLTYYITTSVLPNLTGRRLYIDGYGILGSCLDTVAALNKYIEDQAAKEEIEYPLIRMSEEMKLTYLKDRLSVCGDNNDQNICKEDAKNPDWKNISKMSKIVKELFHDLDVDKSNIGTDKNVSDNFLRIDSKRMCAMRNLPRDQIASVITSSLYNTYEKNLGCWFSASSDLPPWEAKWNNKWTADAADAKAKAIKDAAAVPVGK